MTGQGLRGEVWKLTLVCDKCEVQYAHRLDPGDRERFKELLTALVEAHTHDDKGAARVLWHRPEPSSDP